MKGATESVSRFFRTAIALHQEASPFVCGRWMVGRWGARIILPSTPQPPPTFAGVYGCL